MGEWPPLPLLPRWCLLGPVGSGMNEAVGIFDVHVNVEESLVVE